MFLTSAWSGTPTKVDTARLTRFSQCRLCNKRPFPVKSFPTRCRYKCTYDSRVPYRFTLQCEARGKGMSERNELTPCIYIYSCKIALQDVDLLAKINCITI